MIAFDAQTSGGLLMSVPSEKADNLLEKLHLAGLSDSKVIGYATKPEEKLLSLKN